MELTDADEHGALRGSNLEAKGQNVRLRMGLIMLSVGLCLSVALSRPGLDPLWRLACFVPFFFGAFGAFQGLFRTCPVHVMKGSREQDSGVSPVIRSEERGCARRLARRVWIYSFSVASLATLAVFAVR